MHMFQRENEEKMKILKETNELYEEKTKKERRKKKKRNNKKKKIKEEEIEKQREKHFWL